MNLKDITILTVSFNNNLLTGMMLKSFHKQVGELPEVVIVDNGNKIPVDESFKSCFNVVDNFKNKLSNQPLKSSSQHAWAIDYALKKCIKTKYCLLVDNDILFKPAVKNFLIYNCSDLFDTYGQIGWDCTPPNRLFPYFNLINVEKFNNENLNYYDSERIIKNAKLKNMYDTGYSFYEDIKKKQWKIKNIKLEKFIVHYKSTSLENKNIIPFLNKNKELFK